MNLIAELLDDFLKRVPYIIAGIFAAGVGFTLFLIYGIPYLWSILERLDAAEKIELADLRRLKECVTNFADAAGLTSPMCG